MIYDDFARLSHCLSSRVCLHESDNVALGNCFSFQNFFRDICPLCTILNFTAIPDQLFVVEIFFSVFIFLALSNSLSKKILRGISSELCKSHRQGGLQW